MSRVGKTSPAGRLPDLVYGALALLKWLHIFEAVCSKFFLAVSDKV